MKFMAISMAMLFTACKKDSITTSDTVFVNTTAHQISVTSYIGGVAQAQSQSSFSLMPGESKTVLSSGNGGIGNGATFGAIYSIMDSFVVKFDNAFSITHYKVNFTGSNPKHYPFASGRNIYNEANYQATMKKDAKYRREWELKYTFKEQDYLDAR